MSEKLLYLECYSGISGDMTVSALLDLGADEAVLKKGLDSMGLEGFEYKISRTEKCGVAACDFDVILEDDPYKAHEHDHHHDHHDHDHDHHHDHHHDHDHDHHHDHEHHHPHVHRNLSDCLVYINKMDATDRAKELATKIFTIVAEAEAKAHGKPIDEVHFHEVGAVDSIVDIAAAAICFDNLGLSGVCLSTIYEGMGHVWCQHGILPVPVPAVLNIAEANGLKLKITDNNGEMVTPTGAAIAAALRTKDEMPKEFKILKTGIGAGKKDFKRANILRAMIIEA